MRRALLIAALLMATIPLWSQSIYDELLTISDELRSLQSAFDQDFAMLETGLERHSSTLARLSERLTSVLLRLDGLESEAGSLEDSQTALRRSLEAYVDYARTAITGMQEQIRRLKRELWLYRIGIIILAALASWAVVH